MLLRIYSWHRLACLLVTAMVFIVSRSSAAALHRVCFNMCTSSRHSERATTWHHEASKCRWLQELHQLSHRHWTGASCQTPRHWRRSGSNYTHSSVFNVTYRHLSKKFGKRRHTKALVYILYRIRQMAARVVNLFLLGAFGTFILEGTEGSRGQRWYH